MYNMFYIICYIIYDLACSPVPELAAHQNIKNIQTHLEIGVQIENMLLKQTLWRGTPSCSQATAL